MGNRLLQKRKLVQIGKETTHGTAVAATHQTVLPWAFTPEHPVERPQGLRGFTMRNTGDEVIVSRQTRLALPEYPIAWEELHRLFAMSVKGGVASSQEAVGTDPNAYKWLYERTRALVVDPDTFTFETLEHDGTAGYAKKHPFGFLTDWTVNYNEAGLVTIAANGYAQRDVDMSGAVTDLSASYPAAVTHIQTARTRVWRDLLWANLGTTEFGSEVRSCNVQFQSGMKPLRTMVNDTNLNFDRMLFDPSASGLTIDLEVYAESGAADLFRTIKDNAELAVPSSLRIEVQGALLGATLNAMLRIDAFVKLEAGSLWISGTQDGQQIVGMRFVETAPVGASDPWVSVFLRNNKATL